MHVATISTYSRVGCFLNFTAGVFRSDSRSDGAEVLGRCDAGWAEVLLEELEGRPGLEPGAPAWCEHSSNEPSTHPYAKRGGAPTADGTRNQENGLDLELANTSSVMR